MYSICGVVWFFFSSRRRHTRYIGDWSSDVCSSDLGVLVIGALSVLALAVSLERFAHCRASKLAPQDLADERSEERRVGKECRSRRSQYNKKKKATKLTKIQSLKTATAKYATDVMDK